MVTLLLASMLTLALDIQTVRSNPEIPFFDDFNDGVADGWAEHLGSWSVVSGEYRVSVPGIVENSLSIVDTLTLTECVIETKMRFTDSVGFRAEIVFRYTDNEHYYTFGLSNEYDCAFLVIYTPGDTDYGDVFAHSGGDYSYPIQKDTDYVLKVAIRGDTFICFIDDEELFSGTDNTYDSGNVGLRARRADVYFDNFAVYSSQSQWWNNSWQNRRKVEIVENSGYNLTNFPVEVTFRHDGTILPNGTDIRVIDDGIEIPSYVEDTNTTHAKVVFETNLTSLDTEYLYIYYNNPNASSPTYELVSLDISEGNTGNAIIDNSVYIGWEYCKWGWDGDNNEVVLWTDLKFDFNKDGNLSDDNDLLTDVSGRRGGIGRFRIDYGNMIVRSFGLGNYKNSIQTPIFADIVFENSSLRVYRKQTLVKTTHADRLIIWGSQWDYGKSGLTPEQNVIDGLNTTHGSGNHLYLNYSNPSWMAFRNNSTGELIAGSGFNIGHNYMYFLSAKEAPAWDRAIRFDIITIPEEVLDPNDQPSDCRIYWYGDNSNNYTKIEETATILCNQPTVTIVPDTITVPDDFVTIQEAINRASDGDTVFVRNGTYYENVVVNKTVSLIGENKETTKVFGDDGSPRPAVRLKADGISMYNFTIEGGPVGIEFYHCRDCILRNNEMRNNSQGNLEIKADPWWGGGDYFNDVDSSNTVDGRPIYWWTNQHDKIVPRDAGAVVAAYCHNITVKDLSLSNNSVAVLFYCVYNSEIRNVTTSQNWIAGVHLVRSWNNTIIENNITSNRHHGIYLEPNSINNTIARNNISNNNFGIWLRNDSANNTIYHNNIIGNRVLQVSDTEKNQWDNCCEGNYWSNYNGTDFDGDGIGDEYLPWEGVDNYPLMNLYWNPADVNHDLKVDIYDVVLACSAYTSTPLDPHWNPHCDIAEPYGVIDIFDIVMIAGSYGEEYNP